MIAQLKKISVVALISLVPTLFVWFPYFFRIESVWGIPLPQDGMATVVANYDGPLYIVVAKSLYNPEHIGNFPFGLPANYYAAHFPLFPLLIKTFSVIFGFPYSMLFVTASSAILAGYFFYLLVQEYVEKKHALWMTMVFAVLPARWLIVRSVGSAEPLFIAAIIATIYYFNKEKYWLAGLWGVSAQLTKSPGILLFAALFATIFIPKIQKAATTTFSKWITSFDLKRYAAISLIPLSLIGLFTFYGFQFNDFLAYFHSGDNIHLFFPPFQIFDYSQPWVGTFWLEEVIFVYLFALLGLFKLIKMKKVAEAWFVGIFFVSIIFVSHRDIIRYSLPIFPFILAAFSDTLVKREFKIVMLILIIPIYLFTLSYISQNVMPVSNWGPLL